jgi:hypothetical protein
MSISISKEKQKLLDFQITAQPIYKKKYLLKNFMKKKAYF